MPATYYASGCMLNQVLGGTAFTAPANLYLGLSASAITITGGNVAEPVGNNYSRLTIANTKSNWSNFSSGSIINNSDLSMPQSSGAWPTCVDVFLADASTNGNVWFYKHLDTSIVVQAYTTVVFSASQITFSMTGS